MYICWALLRKRAERGGGEEVGVESEVSGSDVLLLHFFLCVVGHGEVNTGDERM